jgi:asparagine synthase (glutamine-hydrolysing)
MLLGAASDEFNGGYSCDISGDTDWSGFQDSLESMARYGGLLGHPELRPWASFQGACLLQDATLGLGQDIYQSYLESEYHKIAQYNVWHEDRTAAGSGIEARVPFLDHRLVELVTAIPPARRAGLLWDKQILRQAMTGVLPGEFVRRPKVPFFYGGGTADVYRCFAGMLRQDGASLVHEALAQPVASTMLRPDAVLAMLEQSGDALTGELELLLRLVNIGLLEAMTADIPPARVDLPAAPLAPRYLASEWAQAAAELPRRLGLSPGVDPSLPLELGDGVLLADSVSDPGTLFVLVNGVIEYVIDEAPGWAQALRAIDGQTPLHELLSGAGLALTDVEEMLAESVREGLVRSAEPAAPAAGTDLAEPSARARVEAHPA